ncbi:MAG TPA: hypothetical protein VIJ17_14415 [Pseudolabrys sp.]
MADNRTEVLAERSMVIETARKNDSGANVAADTACCKLQGASKIQPLIIARNMIRSAQAQ